MRGMWWRDFHTVWRQGGGILKRRIVKRGRNGLEDRSCFWVGVVGKNRWHSVVAEEWTRDKTLNETDPLLFQLIAKEQLRWSCCSM